MLQTLSTLGDVQNGVTIVLISLANDHCEHMLTGSHGISQRMYKQCDNIVIAITKP